MSAYVKTGNCIVLKCQMETFWLIVSLIVTTSHSCLSAFMPSASSQVNRKNRIRKKHFTKLFCESREA